MPSPIGRELIESLNTLDIKSGRWNDDSDFNVPSTIIDAELGIKITIQGFIEQGIAAGASYKWKPATSTDPDRIVWGSFRWR